MCSPAHPSSLRGGFWGELGVRAARGHPPGMAPRWGCSERCHRGGRGREGTALVRCGGVCVQECVCERFVRLSVRV